MNPNLAGSVYELPLSSLLHPFWGKRKNLERRRKKEKEEKRKERTDEESHLLKKIYPFHESVIGEM